MKSFFQKDCIFKIGMVSYFHKKDLEGMSHGKAEPLS